jgi:large subunit ribosomal protein L4
MAIQTFTKAGTKRETAATLDKTVFAAEANHELISLAYRAYLADGRVAGAKTLTRGEVRGGGRKPWKQKGTGRARAGSIRIPHWRGGGVVFGSTGEENYHISLPLKAKRNAIRQALSVQAADNHISVIEDITTDGKVASTIKLLGKLGFEGQIVIVVAEKTDMLIRATANIAAIELVEATYLNVFTIMNADHLLFTDDALKAVSLWLGEKKIAAGAAK